MQTAIRCSSGIAYTGIYGSKTENVIARISFLYICSSACRKNNILTEQSTQGNDGRLENEGELLKQRIVLPLAAKDSHAESRFYISRFHIDSLP